MGILALDDTDSSIDYSVGWNKAGSALEYNKTTTWTVVAGSTAKIAFHGTSIGVYGTIPAKARRSVAPVSAYSIDGGSLVGFKAVQAAKAQYSQLFFQSPVLPDGAHVLTITNTVASDPLFLDFMLVLQSADSTTTQGIPGLPLPSSASNSSDTLTLSGVSSSSTTSASSTSNVIRSTAAPVTVTITSTAASSSAGSADSANVSPGSAAADNVGSTKKSNAGAIVGGVLGTICVLLLLAFGFVYWNRKRQRRNSIMSYQAAGSGSYWNRPLAAAATPSSNLQSIDPYTVAPSPPPPPPPNMAQNYTPQSANSAPASASAYGQSRYPGGYTPGADYYESSSDLAYAVNPAPAVGAGVGAGGGYNRDSDIYMPQQQAQQQGYSSGYIPPSQLMNSNNGYNNNNYNNSYSDYNRSGGGAPYNSQSGYGYAPENQPGERVRVRLD